MKQQQPAPRRGRPPAAPEDKRHHRSVRLTDAQWEKLRLLGSEWLERAIERAKVPE